jgi:hypothetical protein
MEIQLSADDIEELEGECTKIEKHIDNWIPKPLIPEGPKQNSVAEKDFIDWAKTFCDKE